MAPRKWDAYRSLGITSRGSGGNTCMGTNRYGKRCRWDIEGASYGEICTLLDEMEAQPPNKALNSLGRLARLSLCQDWHQGQQWEVISKWKTAIADAAEEYENRIGLRKQVEELEARAGNQAGLRDLQVEIEKLRSQLSLEQSQRSSTANELASRTLESMNFEKSLRKETRILRRVMAEKDGLEAEVTSLTSQLAQWKDRLTAVDERLQRSDAEKASLKADFLAQVESLKRALEIESSTSSNLRWSLLKAGSEQDASSKMAADVQNQLDAEQQRSTQLVTQLSQANTTLGNERAKFQLQLKAEALKQKELDTELSHSKMDGANLNTANEVLRAELKSEKETSARLRHDLGITKVSLEEAQARLEMFSADEQKASALLRQELSDTQKDLLSTRKALQDTRTKHERLFSETEALRNELASKHIENTQLHQELNTAQQDLATTKLALDESQVSLESSRRQIDDLQNLTAERESRASEIISSLNGRIDFFKSHPFKAFFMALMDAFTKRPKALIKGFKNTRARKATIVTEVV